MERQPTPDHSEPPRPTDGEVDLAPVRRRGESHRLALVSAVALIAIALAVVKPWGQSTPPGPFPATTPSPVVQIARASTQGELPTSLAATQSSDQPGSGPLSFTITFPGPDDSPGLTVVCYASDGATRVVGQGNIEADPSGAAYWFVVPEPSGVGADPSAAYYFVGPESSGAGPSGACGPLGITVPQSVLPDPNAT